MFAVNFYMGAVQSLSCLNLDEAIDCKLPYAFPNGGRNALEERIAELRIGTNEWLIAREHAHLRESLLADHDAAMKGVADAYYAVYCASCSMLDRAPRHRLDEESDLARLRDQIMLHLCTNSSYMCAHTKDDECTYDFSDQHNKRAIQLIRWICSGVKDNHMCAYIGTFHYNMSRIKSVTPIEHASMLRMIADLVVTEYERALPVCDV